MYLKQVGTPVSRLTSGVVAGVPWDSDWPGLGLGSTEGDGGPELGTDDPVGDFPELALLAAFLPVAGAPVSWLKRELVQNNKNLYLKIVCLNLDVPNHDLKHKWHNSWVHNKVVTIQCMNLWLNKLQISISDIWAYPFYCTSMTWVGKKYRNLIFFTLFWVQLT